MKYELFFQDDKSNKFWIIELVGKTYKVSNGRVGANPRTTIKEFANIEEAKNAIEKQVKSKLKKGYKEGKSPAYKNVDWATLPMNNETFWRILNLFNWKKQGDDDAVIKPAVKVLSQLSIEKIYKFEDILSQKLFALDTMAHAKEIGSECYKEGEYFSSDWFLYCRCACITNGEKFYETVLKNPSTFPKDLEFETLITAAREAFELKTNEEWNYKCEDFSYETYSNTKGWKKA